MSAESNGHTTLLPSSLKQSLRRLRFVAQTRDTHGGVGSRRSKKKGEGLEFEDYRPYTFGDDMRRIDPHVYLRLGQPILRQFTVHEQLAITVLLDLSSSMDFGQPSKANVAKSLAAGLSLCALSSGDTLHCACMRDNSIEWYPRLTGVGSYSDFESWLATRRVGGNQQLTSLVTDARGYLPHGGILVLISDMWDSSAQSAIEMSGEAGQDLIVLRTLSPDERDPSSLHSGPVTLVDTETGVEVEIEVGGSSIDSYHGHFADWDRALRGHVRKVSGRFLDIGSDTALVEVFQRHLRASNILR